MLNTMLNMVESRQARLDAGLTAAQVARAIRTATSNVTAYERGAKVPTSLAAARMAAAVRAGAGSPVYRNNLMTIPATAAALRRALRARWATADLLRIVRESRSNARWLGDDADQALFFAPPSTTRNGRSVAAHTRRRPNR
jgi:transcriptional regulator with XRE-family HTH domain